MRRLLATAILSLAALAGLPAAAQDDAARSPEGIAYTSEVAVNQLDLYISTSSYVQVREARGPYAAHVSVDVRAAVERDEDDRTGVVYSADLRCPPGVDFAEGETGSRAAVAWSTGSTFALSLAKHARAGRERDVFRCWLRVVVTSAPATTGTRTTYRDVLLPVDVAHVRRQLPFD